jgi:tRNA threonylcarbamoyladenosine biosynthesis protein TsaB
MSNILAIETTLGGCSVALSNGPSRVLEEPNHQTSRLAGMVESVMTEAGLEYADLNGYAVTTGPGSFTGVRLGIAFIRGLALAVARPIYAVSSLELLAYQAQQEAIEDNLLCVIDAHRKQVYAQKFSLEGNLPNALTEARACGIDQLPAGDFTVTGNALHYFPEHPQQALSPNAKALADYAAQLPEERTEQKPAPLYLRAPDAKPQKPLLAQ